MLPVALSKQFGLAIEGYQIVLMSVNRIILQRIILHEDRGQDWGQVLPFGVS